MDKHGNRSSSRCPAWISRVVKAAVVIAGLASLLSPSSADIAAAPSPQRVVRTQSTPVQYEFSTVERSAVSSNFQDIIIAGGLDGRVYAINAWTGDTLWTFDSGGPMVDSSSCGVPASPQQEQNQEHEQENHRAEPWRTTTVDVDGTLDTITNKDERAVIEKRRESAEVMTTTAAVMAELVPSYDGRLYHLSKSQVKELEMTMVDIINANGPVRLVDDGPDGDNLSDIILFGEKKTEIFALDATNGLIQPYYPVSAASSPVMLSKDVLFGRSEFTTRAVHARNASSSRCFKIAEYFLQFTDQSRCSFLDKDKSQIAYFPPDILVLPKDPDASEEDEGSTITAYDPWTNKQLWEIEIPHFEVLAVYGISTTRGSTFYQWKVDGPSSHASSKRRELSRIEASDEKASAPGSSASARQKLLEKQEPDHRFGVEDAGSKQLANVVSRNWVSMESRFRLRLLGENYYLESSTDEVSNLSDDVASSSATPLDESHIDELFRKQLPRGRKRRIFWEPIVNDGKRGVFITYYHVGAMMVGVTVGCLLIAWGCYVKGLSASIAHNAIKSMDGSQFFMSHVHQLTIERPGEETITISSVIGRPLLMTALGSSSSLPMLENGEQTSSRSSSIDVNIDPETEAELMEKFARMAAIEAASRYSSSKSTMLQLEYDADAADTSVSSAIVVRPRGPSPALHSKKPILTLTSAVDAADIDSFDELIHLEEKIPASIVQLESMSDNEKNDVEAKAAEEVVDKAGDADISVESSEKSEISSWSSDTDSSSSSDGDNSNGSGSSVESSAKSNDSLSSKTEDQSKQRKGSDASSSDSSHANEAEVLFPFVCQSRFANEFEEISAIGKGGFGQVILAENRLDGRKYAIKRVGLHLKNQTSKTLQKFLREVKILALLDHPNIVRYYQAWLEKVEDSVTGLFGTPSDLDSSLTGVPGRNYSMSNLLAPISEMEFSENQRSQMDFYSDAGGLEDEDDGGFEWERDSSAGASEGQAWREEDLVQSNGARRKRRQEVVAANRPAKESATDDDISVDKCDHWLYIQMQYCAGRNLGDYLALPNRPMELSKVLKIFVQIASALAHVHSCGLIHRDLKPANIFVADTEGDSIKLGDFGLSRYAANVNLNAPATVEEHHQQLTTTVATSSTNIASGHHMYSSSVWSVSMSNVSEAEVTAGVGTYLYASPEQVAGKKYNAKTDVYSLGMILFELCHERFTTTMERYIALRNARENVFPVEFRWNQRSPELMTMVSKLLSHDPAARPSADEVVKWGQEFYESSLAHQAMSAMRSPLNPSRAFGNVPMTSFDLMAPVDAPSTFSFHVEAKAEECGAENGPACGERRLPNHNLLKEICDVIGQVGNDLVEIKKCGLQLQDGVQILEFVLDAPLASDTSDGDRYTEIVAAIEALPGVEQVRQLGL